MSFKHSQQINFFKHSLRLVFRYQQVYLYPVIVIVFILLPKWFSVNEKYFVFLFSFNLIIILWLYSPYYISQFSFSSEDARSLSLFDISFQDLVRERNLINFILLLIPVILNLSLSVYIYPIDDQILYGLIILSFLSLLPAMTIGNYLTGSSIRWNTTYNMSWKSIFIILSTFFTDFVIKTSILLFSTWVAGIIFIALFILYLTLYYLSFRKIVRNLSTYFSSIAEE